MKNFFFKKEANLQMSVFVGVGLIVVFAISATIFALHAMHNSTKHTIENSLETILESSHTALEQWEEDNFKKLSIIAKQDSLMNLMKLSKKKEFLYDFNLLFPQDTNQHYFVVDTKLKTLLASEKKPLPFSIQQKILNKLFLPLFMIKTNIMKYLFLLK